MCTNMLQLLFVYLNVAIIMFGVDSMDMMCNRTEYFDPEVLSCQSCPVNVSMVASADGFSCVCEEDSIRVGVERCKRCNATEVLSADGTACVPRKCQASSGRFICRKCPADYISVTHNFDGSLTKEVLCVKCARGYKVYNNACVHCPSCVCAKNELAVAGVCVAKQFVNDRPKHEGKMHSTVLLDVVKHEYLCTKGDLLSCRALAQECVKHYYTDDVSGPCRLWVQPKVTPPKGLPELVVVTKNDMKPGEIILPHGKDSLMLVLAVYMANGGLKIMESPEKPLYECFLPLEVSIGRDLTRDCEMNITELMLLDDNSTYSVYLSTGGVFKPLPIVMQKPGGYFVKPQSWSSNNLRRFFLAHNFVTSNNVSSSVYLRTLFIRVGLERDKYESTSLRVRIRIEAQYTSKFALSSKIVTTLKVQHEMPSAGILRGMEIWGGVLGCLSSLYALVQWRGETRRGGLQFCLVPHLAGGLSDALYFAVFFSTIHALAAEAGAIGITLPLSAAEEHVIRAFIYSTLSLKAIKIAWFIWKQCSCNISFLDWSEYNCASKDALSQDNAWRITTLAKEWKRLQTLRYAPPIYTIVLTLVVVRLMTSWQHHLGQIPGYKWAAAGIAWWGSYAVVLATRWVLYKVTASPPTSIPRTCKAIGVSLLVFEEEYYAHYVHGRNSDDKDVRLISGPINMCRVVMAPQLRTVFNQLSSSRHDDLDSLEKHALLSRLLAAFFERALDGLNWVASERSLLERLLGVELTDREGGSTSVLLYDVGETVPSCTAVTWWGIEWSLGCMDAMLFGAVVFATEDPALAALVTLLVWQVMEYNTRWFSRKNKNNKTNIDF